MHGPTTASPDDPQPAGGAYSWWVLAVLVAVYVLNFLDRQILSILNEPIRRDLGLDDSQMGFLFGTAFAVFYALFGIPLGRLADLWIRRSLIAAGLAFWSAMTALSGLASGFASLAAARVGVGIGEASAAPAAYSMLADYFPARRRATVFAIYSSGIYIGAGLGLMIGGQVVDRWDAAFASGAAGAAAIVQGAAGAAPWGLRGWQVAFFVVGLPGLALAVLVRTLREPAAGAAGRLPLREALGHFAGELAAVLPPLTAWTAWRQGTARGLGRNLSAAAVVAAVAAALAGVTGDRAQWAAVGVGLYASFSWFESLRARDPAAAAAILDVPTLRWAALAFGFLSFSGYSVGYWATPWFMRVRGVPASEVGMVVGAVAAVAGWLGVSAGGALADAWRARSPRGRLYTGMLTAVLTPVMLGALLAAPSNTAAFVLNAPMTLVSSAWIGAGIATVHDLVPVERRGTATAAYLLVVTMVGLALGPYFVGKMSAATGSLGTGLAAGAVVGDGMALACLAMAARHLPADLARQNADAWTRRG